MPFLFCFCGYEKLCFLKFLLTFLIIEFSEGNPPPSAKNKWAAQAFLCSDICPSFKKWGQFVRRQLKHVFRIEASKVSPSCLSKFASFFFCHPHATKEKTCLKKILNLQWQQWSIFVLLRKFDVGLFLPDWTNYISKQMKLYDFNFYGLWLGFIPSRHDFLESLSNFFSPPVNKVDLNNGVTSSTTEHQSIYRFQKIEHRGSRW